MIMRRLWPSGAVSGLWLLQLFRARSVELAARKSELVLPAPRSELRAWLNPHSMRSPFSNDLLAPTPGARHAAGSHQNGADRCGVPRASGRDRAAGLLHRSTRRDAA